MDDAGQALWQWDGPNPIVGCGLAFEFDRQFSQETIKAIGQLRSKFSKRLPRQQFQQMMMVPFGAAAFPQGQESQKTGVLFDRTRADGQQEVSLGISLNTVRYVTTSYTRWDEVWADARNLFQPVMDLVADGTKLVTIVVEYTDRFLAKEADVHSFPVRSLLKPSPFVATNIFDCDGFWHCNHGFFRSDASLPGGQLLENVNVSLVEARPNDEPTLQVDVVINQRFTFLEARSLARGESFAARGGVLGLEDEFAAVHIRNKELLSALLLPSVGSRIPGLDMS